MPRQAKPAPAEVFLSHSTKNGAFTRRLADVLARHGMKSFVSQTSIRGAQQWHDEIGSALKRCAWFIMYALQTNRYRERIVPVLYRDCDADSLSWTLSAIEWVDFREDFRSGCRQLLRVWGLDYDRRP